MKKRLFDDLKESLQEAVQISQGLKKPARVFKYDPVDVKQIREQVNVTQQVFAQMIGVSVDTVQNWEQGRRIPTGPAQVLLRVFENDPQAVIKVLEN